MTKPLPDPASVERILVRATNWIGDIVMISPSLRALRRRYPAARIDVVAAPRAAACLEGSPWVDEVIRFDRRGADRGATGLFRLAARLRSRRYDMAVLFQKAMGAALMASLARVPIRIGLATDGRSFLLTHPVPLGPELARRHHVEIFLEVARRAGCDVSDPTPSFEVGVEEESWAAEFLRSERAERFAFLVGIHAFASKKPRAWHTDRFVETARSLAGRHRAWILLFGGPGESGDVAGAARALGECAINACARSSVKQMAALLKRCRIFLGNDSGPMHVASALGVPVVAIFGPGDPTQTAPYPGRGPVKPSVLSRRYPCAPCRQDFFKECYPAPSGKPYCLESISVEEVLAEAERLLAS